MIGSYSDAHTKEPIRLIEAQRMLNSCSKKKRFDSLQIIHFSQWICSIQKPRYSTSVKKMQFSLHFFVLYVWKREKQKLWQFPTWC